MTEEQINKADSINWFHTIKLSNEYATKGRVGLEHCSPESLTNRFGLPESLDNKTVLDIGIFDGMASFEAEKRGAKVTGIDIYQGKGENKNGFLLAREVLNSNVELFEQDILDFAYLNQNKREFDYVLCYGVLYHVDSPIDVLKAIYGLLNENGECLLETAIAQADYGGRSVWEFNNGFDGDFTNKWYCTVAGLTNVIRYVGFSNIELIWTDKIRATVKLIK